MSRPSRLTAPLRTRERPLTTHASVLFPAPLAPSTATASPGLLDEQHGDAVVADSPDQLTDRLELTSRQPGGDLVEQQQRRPQAQRPRQFESLEIEQSERARGPFGEAVQTAPREHPVDEV